MCENIPSPAGGFGLSAHKGRRGRFTSRPREKGEEGLFTRLWEAGGWWWCSDGRARRSATEAAAGPARSVSGDTRHSCNPDTPLFLLIIPVSRTLEKCLKRRRLLIFKRLVLMAAGSGYLSQKCTVNLLVRSCPVCPVPTLGHPVNDSTTAKRQNLRQAFHKKILHQDHNNDRGQQVEYSYTCIINTC